MAELYTDADEDYRDTVIEFEPPPAPYGILDESSNENKANDYRSSWKSSFVSGSGGSIGKRIMEQNGWAQGGGLGRDGQGRVEALDPTPKYGRGGLGYKDDAPAIEAKTHSIDVHKTVPIRQDPKWIISNHAHNFEPDMIYNDVDKWVVPKEETDYNLFCEKDRVDRMFAAKSRFDNVPKDKFLSARRRSNPYEKIGKHFFQNRAAMKMANMDSMFELTKPPDGNSELYFADVCAGPGGFTEYMMWRCKTAYGWGFTLKGKDDWRLDKFNPGAPKKNFRTSYGEDGTGNIMKTENIKHFAHKVAKETYDRGLHLCTADGGFSVKGEENLQEIKVRQLVLCQFAMGLSVLSKGGNFMCKIFDCFTPFTVGLLYILYRHFEKFCIIKPFTSRPANSERYVVCMGLKQQNPPVLQYLYALNDKLNTLLPEGQDIHYTVSMDILNADKAFLKYIRNSNIQIITEQIDGLETLMKYIEDENLLSLDQNRIKDECLEEWSVQEHLNPYTHVSKTYRSNRYSHDTRPLTYSHRQSRRGSDRRDNYNSYNRGRRDDYGGRRDHYRNNDYGDYRGGRDYRDNRDYRGDNRYYRDRDYQDDYRRDDGYGYDRPQYGDRDAYHQAEREGAARLRRRFGGQEYEDEPAEKAHTTVDLRNKHSQSIYARLDANKRKRSRPRRSTKEEETAEPIGNKLAANEDEETTALMKELLRPAGSEKTYTPVAKASEQQKRETLQRYNLIKESKLKKQANAASSVSVRNPMQSILGIMGGPLAPRGTKRRAPPAEASTNVKPSLKNKPVAKKRKVDPNAFELTPAKLAAIAKYKTKK